MDDSELLINGRYAKPKVVVKFHKRLRGFYIQITVVLLLLVLYLFAAMPDKSHPVNNNKVGYLRRLIWNFSEANANNTGQASKNLANSSRESANNVLISSDLKSANINRTKYLTSSLGATCVAGLSNRLFEMVSLYGMARTLNRIPYIDKFNRCLMNRMNEFASLFPNFAQEFEQSRYLLLDTLYLQSFKYFHQYRQDVLRLLQFASEDIKMAEQIASDASFLNNSDHKLCVHVRRGDYIRSSIHQSSTENFTRGAVLYLKEKLRKANKKTIVAILGDDRQWAKKLFESDSWARVPGQAARSTVDYAFFARHCQTILITASASTFAFWSSYLSSAENVYYNKDYARGAALKNDLTPADFYLPSWISLAQNKLTMEITEERTY